MKSQSDLPRWERLVELSQDLFCVTDPECRLTFINPAWRQLLQYSQNELRGRSLLDMVHPDDRARAEHAFASLMANRSVDEMGIRCIAKDGTTRQISWGMTLVREE